LKLNGTYQLLVYTDDNILEGSIHTVKKNAEAFVVANKEIGLEVNADKTKFMIMSGDQNAGGSHSLKTDNSCFESVEEFRYLGTNLTDQNSIQEEIEKGEVRECLLSFVAEFFVFHCAIQKFND
jgi:hypothetical protein